MEVLKKLLPRLLPHKLMVAAIIGFGIVMSVTESITPYLLVLFFDGLQGKRTPTPEPLQWAFGDLFGQFEINFVLVVPLLIPVFYFLHGVARFFHMYFMKYFGEVLTTEVQKDLQEKYMVLSLTHHSGQQSGALISKTISDVLTLKDGFSTFFELVREPITIICLLTFILSKDWKTTLVLLLIAPIVLTVVSRFSRTVRKYSTKQQQSMEVFTSTIKETVDGVRIIQSFNLIPEMKRRLQKVIDGYISIRKKVISGQEGVGPINEFLLSGIVAGFFYVKGTQIMTGGASVGDLMGYFGALAFITQPVKRIQDGLMRIQPVIASATRIFETLESTEVVPESPHPKPFPDSWKTIEFRNVTFSYGSQNVLKNVNLEIRRGEVIALVGESGSGKSTFVNLLERFYDPSSGKIFIGGVDLRDLDLRKLRDHVALVTQDVFLFNDSIEANIRSGGFSRHPNTVNRQTHSPADLLPGDRYSAEQAAKLANAHDFIMRTPEGYQTSVGDRGGRLSGGEKQRISIARAIYKDAPILILDEATSALDSASEVEVQKGLDRLMEGRTAFVIAHRLSTVASADRILVFKSGEIVESGTHQQLLSQKGAYFEFHRLQTMNSN